MKLNIYCILFLALIFIVGGVLVKKFMISKPIIASHESSTVSHNPSAPPIDQMSNAEPSAPQLDDISVENDVQSEISNEPSAPPISTLHNPNPSAPNVDEIDDNDQ